METSLSSNSISSDPLKKQAPEFLHKLFKILQQEDRSIIEWDSGHIRVKDPSRLARNILNKYFRHNKFSSFQRQLNYFGFHKTEGKGKHAPCVYTNDALVGASLDELLVIKRKTSVAMKTGSPLFGGAITSESPSPLPYGPFPNAEVRSAQLDDFQLMHMDDYHRVLDTVLKKRNRDHDEPLSSLTNRAIESLPDLFLQDTHQQLQHNSTKRSKTESTGVPRIKTEPGVISQNDQTPHFLPYPSKMRSFSEQPFNNPAGQFSMFNLDMMPYQNISRGTMDFKPIRDDVRQTSDCKVEDTIFSANFVSKPPLEMNSWEIGACASDCEINDPAMFPLHFEPFPIELDLKQPNEEADWVWDVLNEALIDDPQLNLDDGLIF